MAFHVAISLALCSRSRRHGNHPSMRMMPSCVVALAGLLTAACSVGSAETMQRGSAVPVEQATSNSNEHHINTLTEQIVGDWRSVCDGKELVTFGADGSWMSSYDGNASEAGRWMLFAGNAPPPAYLTASSPQRTTCRFCVRIGCRWCPKSAASAPMISNSFISETVDETPIRARIRRHGRVAQFSSRLRTDGLRRT